MLSMIVSPPHFVIALVVLASPALALDCGSSAQDLAPIKASKADLSALVITNTSPSEPCLSTDGAFATDGTQSWQPTCFGTFTAPGQTVRVYPTRGTGKNKAGLPDDSKMYTGNLIQAQGDGAIERETNGQFINMETIGGAVSAGSLDSTNATGQLISMRQRPGPNRERPPTTWGHNVDFHIAPGAGNVQSYGVEYDMNNFNKDCAPGSGCLSSAMFFNGIGGYANTAWLYSGGGSTQTRAATGTISNGTITRMSGEAFTPGVFQLSIGGSNYHVHYVSADVAQADEAIPSQSSAFAYSWTNSMVHFGILFQGASNVSDADLALHTSAYTAVRAAGQHRVAFDSSGDAALFAMTSKAGQATCFNGFSACLTYTEGYLQYQENGSSAFEILTVANNRNGLRVTGGATAVGPILEPTPTSSDANLALNLRAKGSGTIQALSPVSFTAGVVSRGVTGVSCSGPPTKNFQVTAGIVTRC